MNGERPAAAREWAIVGGVYLALVLVAAAWLWIDRRPPEWDHANHLERVVHCAHDIARGDVRAIIERPSFYPAVAPCAAALVYRLVLSNGAADRVTLGGVALPSTLVDWVVRTPDPSLRIASRLPVPVTLGRIDITPEAIRITARP